HDKDAVPVLIELVALPAAELRWQVEEMLLRVGGEDGPAAPSSNDAQELQQYRERWARWWSANAAKVDLARLAHDPPQRGWAAVSQMRANRIYEIDRRGKERWAISGVSGPIDAQVLPGERVLVAEHHGSKVTERNLRGDVLWEKKLSDRPVAVQRLPNGNTFI